ncbi:hypothetical protein Tco_1549289 [Tanacetum coccineum]
MFRINSCKTSREDKFVLINKARASVRTKPITISQPHVITKKDVNSDSNDFSSTGVDNTIKTRRPQPRSNTKNDRVPSTSKSSCITTNEVENDKSEVICAMCNQYLITVNHDVCVLNYVNAMNSHLDNQNSKVSNTANQKKHKAKVKNSKKLGSKERPTSPKPSKPRLCLRWSPTRRIFDCSGKLIESSNSECQPDSSKGCPNLFMKFLGTVRFVNDHIAAILGYGHLQ